MFSNTTDILRSDRPGNNINAPPSVPPPPLLPPPRFPYSGGQASEYFFRRRQEKAPINQPKSSFHLVTLSLDLFAAIQDKFIPGTHGLLFDHEELERQEDRFKICSSNLGIYRTGSDSKVRVNLPFQDVINQLLHDVAETLTELSQVLVSAESSKIAESSEDKGTWQCPVVDCTFHESGLLTEKERDSHVEEVHHATSARFKCEFHTCPFETEQETDYAHHMETHHTLIDTKPTDKGNSHDGLIEQEITIGKDLPTAEQKDLELNKEESAAILLDVISDTISKLLKLASTPGVYRIRPLGSNREESAHCPPLQGDRGLSARDSSASGTASGRRGYGPIGWQPPSSGHQVYNDPWTPPNPSPSTTGTGNLLSQTSSTIEGHESSVRANSVANLLTPPSSHSLAPHRQTGSDSYIPGQADARSPDNMERGDLHVTMLAKELGRLRIIPNTHTVDHDVQPEPSQSQFTFQSRYIPENENIFSPLYLDSLNLASEYPAYPSPSIPLAVGPLGDRPFKCDVCSQSFNRNHDLKRHKRIHLAVKPFPCGYCDKSFSRKDALKRHILIKGCGRVDQASDSMTATVADDEDDDTDKEEPESDPAPSCTKARCGRVGHDWWNCPKIECYRCKGSGHISRNCSR